MSQHCAPTIAKCTDPVAVELRRQELDGCCPWNLGLVFWDEAMEQRFWDLRLKSKPFKLGLLCYLHGAVSNVITWYHLCIMTEAVSQFTHAEHAGIVAFGSWLAWQHCSEDTWYAKRRGMIAGMFRILLHVVLTRDVAVMATPGASILQFLSSSLLKSIAPAVTHVMLLMQLKFRHQVLVSVVCILITLIYGSPRYCLLWSRSDTLSAVYSPVSSTIDQVILQTTLPIGGKSSLSDDGALHTCCDVIFFIDAIFGFIIPTAALYVLECHSRLVFLTTMKEVSVGWSVRRFCETLLMVCWFVVICSMALWACVRLAPVPWSKM